MLFRSSSKYSTNKFETNLFDICLPPKIKNFCLSNSTLSRVQLEMCQSYTKCAKSTSTCASFTHNVPDSTQHAPIPHKMCQIQPDMRQFHTKCARFNPTCANHQNSNTIFRYFPETAFSYAFLNSATGNISEIIGSTKKFSSNKYSILAKKSSGTL